MTSKRVRAQSQQRPGSRSATRLVIRVSPARVPTVGPRGPHSTRSLCHLPPRPLLHPRTEPGTAPLQAESRRGAAGSRPVRGGRAGTPKTPRELLIGRVPPRRALSKLTLLRTTGCQHTTPASVHVSAPIPEALTAHPYLTFERVRRSPGKPWSCRCAELRLHRGTGLPQYQSDPAPARMVQQQRRGTGGSGAEDSGAAKATA